MRRSLIILGAAFVVGVLIVVGAGVSKGDIVSWRSRGNSSQIGLVQVNGISYFADVALDVFESCFQRLHGAQ